VTAEEWREHRRRIEAELTRYREWCAATGQPLAESPTEHDPAAAAGV
jgi:hypothetical protein